MKKILYYSLLMLSGIVFLFSCRKDLSTYDTDKITGVSFDTTGQSSLSVFQFDTLVLNPKLATGGLNEADLKYEWRINADPGSLDYRIIGTERNLAFPVELKPTTDDEKYQILYTITDNKTGLQYIMAWPLAIRNSIGEGLVIAETADGTSTDLSHIMSPLVTPDYNKVSVKHHVFSAINEATIPGVLKQLRYTKLNGVGPIMMGISDHSIAAVKTLDYTLARMNEDLFFASVPDRTNQMIGGLTQSDVYVGNGRLSAVWLEISKKFGLPYDSKYTVPDHVALNGNNNYPAVVIDFYDEAHGYFVYQSSVSYGDTKMHEVPADATAPFDPANLPGKMNLAAGVTQSGEFLHLLKDKTSNAVGLYVMDGGGYDANWNLVPPAPEAYFDLSDAPDIQNATRYVLLDDQKVLYYATPTKIYAVLYGTSTPSFAERYTAPAGEEITTLQVYRQGDYPKRVDGWDPPYLPTNNRQLIMSTYNGSEGKVYIMPMINLGVGNIDAANIKVFNGFDRITAVGTQL